MNGDAIVGMLNTHEVNNNPDGDGVAALGPALPALTADLAADLGGSMVHAALRRTITVQFDSIFQRYYHPPLQPAIPQENGSGCPCPDCHQTSGCHRGNHPTESVPYRLVHCGTHAVALHNIAHRSAFHCPTARLLPSLRRTIWQGGCHAMKGACAHVSTGKSSREVEEMRQPSQLCRSRKFGGSNTTSTSC